MMSDQDNNQHQGQYDGQSSYNKQYMNCSSEVVHEGNVEDDENRNYEEINFEEKYNQLGDYDLNGMPKEESKIDEFINEIIYYDLINLHSQAREEGLLINGDCDRLIEEQYFRHLEQAEPIQDPKGNNLLLLKEMMSKRNPK